MQTAASALQASNGYVINVKTNTAPDGTGFIPILWVNQQTGQAMTAYLDGSVAQLSKLPAPYTN